MEVVPTKTAFILGGNGDDETQGEPETPGVDGATEAHDYSEDSENSWEEESSSDDEEDPRSRSYHAAFLLTLVAPVLDVVAVWRYPYIAYKHGGIVLIPCLILYFFVALPVVYLELTLGQLYGGRSNNPLGTLVPMLKGFCFSACALLVVMSVYHMTIISWCLFYFFTSMQDSLPWAKCMENNATKGCRFLREPILSPSCSPDLANCTANLELLFNQTAAQEKSASEHYFHQIMLHASDGLSALGPLSWKLCLCSLCAWFFVFMDVRKGKISFRKTSALPTLVIGVVLCIMMGKATMEDGFKAGVHHYFDYKWSSLMDLRVWMDSGTQVVLSLGLGTGLLQSLGRRSRVVGSMLTDAVVLVVTNALADFFAGLVAFSCLGFMASRLKATRVDFLQKELGTAFVVFSSSLAEFPAAIVWALLFFAVLALVSLRRQQAIVYGIASAILEALPTKVRAKRHRRLIIFAICLLLMGVGFIFTFKIGIHLLAVIDLFAVGWPSFALILIECIGVMFFYGRRKLVTEMEVLLQKNISVVWVIAWAGVAPVISGVLLVFGVVFVSHVVHEGVDYTSHARLIGWTLATFVLCFGPIYLGYKFIADSGRRRFFGQKGDLSKIGERLATQCSSGLLSSPETPTENSDKKNHWRYMSQRRKGSITPAPKILVVKMGSGAADVSTIPFGFVLTPSKQAKAAKTTGRLLTTQQQQQLFPNEEVTSPTSVLMNSGRSPSPRSAYRPSPRLRLDIPPPPNRNGTSPRSSPRPSPRPHRDRPKSHGTLLSVPQATSPMRPRAASDASDVRQAALSKDKRNLQRSTQHLSSTGVKAEMSTSGQQRMQ